jgi:quinol monooxygenase YgiN
VTTRHTPTPDRPRPIRRALRPPGRAAPNGQDPSYLGTELWALGDDDGRYLLIDRWRSREHYRAFRTRHRDEYDRRSAETAPLYASERLIGEMLRR